jgi:hypothetical protein
MICSHLFALLNYRITARHTYRATEVQQSGWRGNKTQIFTELPKCRIR